MLTLCPAPVLRDFAEVVRLIEVSPPPILTDLQRSSKAPSSDSPKLEWYLTMPPQNQLAHPGLPRAGSITFAYSAADSSFKALVILQMYLSDSLALHQEGRCCPCSAATISYREA